MSAVIIIAGIVWVGYQICREACIKQVPEGSDFLQANQDYFSGKYSAKEVDKRMKNGYYVVKNK